MRILIISRCPPWPLHLGDRLIVYHLGRELSLRKHEIDLLAFAQRPEDWQEQDHYDFEYELVQLVQEQPRSALRYLQRLVIPATRWPRRAEELWSPQMWRLIEEHIQVEKYDVVHLIGGIQVYEFYHALRGLPAVITPYESYSLYLKRAMQIPSPRSLGRSQSPPHPVGRGWGWGLNLLQHQIARRYEQFMFTPYARTVVLSEQDKAELLAINPALKVEVIPNGIDLYEFRFPRVQRKANALLFLGNYEYAPNVDAALTLARYILPEVRKRLPGVKLWLVGNNPPPEILALQESSGLKPTVKVTGRVPDVRPYFARAKAFVCPLRMGAGIKNKVLEALALGCPVIATPLSVDGIDALDGQEVLIAEVEQMADTIVRLLEDADLQRTLAMNGRKLIESRYSWDHVAEKYLALYREIL